jgi:hypothetical protein
MDAILSLLLYRLLNRGLVPKEVPWLIRDVLNIVSDGGEFTVETINHKLTNLGWGEQIVDQSTLELIISLLEIEEGLKVERHNLH